MIYNFNVKHYGGGYLEETWGVLTSLKHNQVILNGWILKSLKIYFYMDKTNMLTLPHKFDQLSAYAKHLIKMECFNIMVSLVS